MKIDLVSHGLRFLVLSLFQILILNHLSIFDFATAYLYVFFILALPLNISNALLLTLSFISGLTIDIFTNTLGMHASACVTVAFIRPFLLEIIAPREGYGAVSTPVIHTLGLAWFTKYAAILLIFHHLVLFLIEYFKFNEVHRLFGKVIICAAFSLVIMIVIQYLNKPQKRFE